MNIEKYLPIGSVVLLKEAKKRVMVIGFAVKNKNTNESYDYVGCLFPEGVISSKKTLLFNHDQIEKIFFVGHSDMEEQEFKKKLDKMVNKTTEE